MKKSLWLLSFVMVVALIALPGCGAGGEENIEVMPSELKGDYPDGRYRGSFFDSGDYEVAVQFEIVDGLLTNLRFRHLYWRGDDYLNPESEDNVFVFGSEDLEAMRVQHDQLLEYLEGKPVSAIGDLFTPENMVEDIDGWSGATIRSAKVISALRDALNRGVYRHP